MSKRQIFVTSALPYANGPLHLGHLLEAIQTDIFARFQRLSGNDCFYLCADDTHGTPVMLKAESLGTTPEEMISAQHISHVEDFKAFLIDFAHYHSTHSKESEELVRATFLKLDEKGLIERRVIEQLFDPERNMFLPDRFVVGQCPKCGAKDQYGDSCDVCGATYDPTDLVEPKSKISGATPILKESEHLFFDLTKLESDLSEWIETDALQQSVKHKMREWFESGLKAWDISRDAPYFGFQIPGYDDKYFYVWLDAPLGYFASLKAYCRHAELDFDALVAKDSTAEMHHFIGKDVTYFHALFWPALLKAADYRDITKLHVHGFLTINGTKMSKSKGTFILASDAAKAIPVEALRYYFAAKLNGQIEDIDCQFEDLVNRVNSDLVGKTINIASRSAKLLHKHFEGALIYPESPLKLELQQAFEVAIPEILAHYESLNTQKAMRDVMHLADLVNQWLSEEAPWTGVKGSDDSKQRAHYVLSDCINYFHKLIVLLSPVLPNIAQKASVFLNTDAMAFKDLASPLNTPHIGDYEALLNRLKLDDIEQKLGLSE